MGNWNRRYLPRRKFRHCEYDDPPLSPPRPYNHHSSGVEDNRVPSWEIEYCKSVRVPWHKVLASKKYIYCHPRVQNWDDSAGKEAFQNAKQRYWAKINCLLCDNPLPDPEMYVDEIDWNLHMDPELMADLDLQAFNPDKPQKVEKLETINEEVERARTHYDKNQPTNDNPWERSIVNDESLKDAVLGWGRWDDSVNLKSDDPWEQSCGQAVDSLKDNHWKSGNESWGWGNTNAEGSRNSGNRGYFCENNYSKEKDWRDKKNESWGWKNNKNESWGSRDSTNESWGWKDNKNELWGSRDNRNESWGSRKSGYQSNEPKYWDSGSFRWGGKSFRGGCRKRESSLQHTSKYKSSRYHGDNYVDSRPS